MVFKTIGLGFCCGVTDDTNLRRNSREKTVMFENAEKVNADISKDKRTVYRYHRLSREDKADLYTHRPDLNTKDKSHLLKQPLMADHKRESRKSRGVVLGQDGQPIKSSMKKTKTAGIVDNADGRMVCAVAVSVEDSSPNNNSHSTGSGYSQSTDSIGSTTRKALKIGNDEVLVSPHTSVDKPAKCSSSPTRSQDAPLSGKTLSSYSLYLSLLVEENVQR